MLVAHIEPDAGLYGIDHEFFGHQPRREIVRFRPAAREEAQ